ncbi:MAG: DUF4097 family beta strand repeat-containing protein [Butyricicoccaceae bacterium]
MNRTLQICLGGLVCTAILMGIGVATADKAPIADQLSSAYAELTGDYRKDAKEHHTLDLSDQSFDSLYLDINAVEVTISSGDTARVEYWGDSDFLKWTVDNGTLKLTSSDQDNLLNGYWQNHREVALVLPQSELDNVFLKTEAGYIDVQTPISCSTLSMDIDAGSIGINEELVCKALTANIDAGSFYTSCNADIGSFRFDIDAGNAVLNGIVRENSEVVCDAGSFELYQSSDSRLGTLNVKSKDFADVSINDGSLPQGVDSATIGTGKAVLTVDVDAGSINIYTPDYLN